MKKQLPLLLFILLAGCLQLAAQNIYTVAGGGAGFFGDGGPATLAAIRNPLAIIMDPAGNAYICDQSNHRIRKVDAATGFITTIAGGAGTMYNGDNIPATTANIGAPSDIAFDNAGDLYIADTWNHRIRKITMSTGIITTVAGVGTNGYNGDGISGLSAQLNYPAAVYVNAAGDIFIADHNNSRIRKVTQSTGLISTVAGTTTAGYNGDNMAATSARLNYPTGIVADAAGHLYITDNRNHRIRKVNASTGVITTIAGTGTSGYNGDGISATSARLNLPHQVKLDASGNIYITDKFNDRVRKITVSSGLITTIAGNGFRGYNGDGVAATSTWINTPSGFCFDASGNFYFTEHYNYRVRKVTVSTGIISTFVGNGVNDGALATAVPLYHPSGSCVDQYGNIYIADDLQNRIRKVEYATGILTTVAGNGSLGYNGDGIPARSASLSTPQDVAVDLAGNIYISDRGNHRIRKVDVVTGLISTIAGTSSSGYNGDGIAATTAQLNQPVGLELDAAGNVYVADWANHRVRKITVSTGLISTIAGTGTGGYNGDNIPATSAQLDNPVGLGISAAGHIYIGEEGGHRIRMVHAANGYIGTVAGTGILGSSVDGVAAITARVFYPFNICFDPAGNVYFAERGNNRIRKITVATGLLSTVAGNGSQGYNGDNIPATTARLNNPTDVDMDASGNFIIADQNNNRMRFVQASVITVQPTSVSICSNDGTTFSITASGTTYQWEVNTGAGFTSLVNNATYSGVTTTTLQITNASAAMNAYQYRCRVDGVYYSYVVTLGVSTTPTVSANASPSATVCNGSPLTLTGSGAASYSWSGGVFDGVAFTPTVSGSYTVTGTAASGCVDTATIAITVSTSPVVTITGNSVICNGDTTTLTAGGASTYAWSSGGNAANETLSPSTTTTYSVVGTSNGCMDTATISVTVNPLPAITVSGNTTVCSGNATTLYASGASVYSWSTGGNGASETITPVSTTTITVTGTSTNGCVNSATVTITVIPLPVVSVSGNTVSCAGSPVTLTASGALAYAWSTGGNSASVIVSPTISATYTVTGMSGICSSTATISIAVNALPFIWVSGNTSVCANDSTTLTASGASTYSWSTGGTGASETVAPSVSTSYAVTGTDANGCTNTTIVAVNVNALPNLSVSGDTVLCAGESTTLTASGAGSYAWSTGGNSPVETITPVSSTTITVTGTDLNQCSSVVSFAVSVHALPVTAFTVPMDTVCDNGGQISLNANPAGGVFSGPGVNGTQFDPQASGAGWHVLTYLYTDSNGCSAGASDSVFVDGCMGINTLNDKSMSVSPNPSAGVLDISFAAPVPENSFAEFFDAAGRLVLVQELTPGATRAQLHAEILESGLYILRVHAPGYSVQQRILIQH